MVLAGGLVSTSSCIFFSAHRLILAASSPVFKAMFSGKFKETKSKVIPMKEMTFVGLKNIVDCFYTTKIKITAKNIEDILPAAHLLQLNDIIDECTDWMVGKLTKTNCFSFLKMAEKYSIEKVESAVNKFILENFVSVCQTKAFSMISKQALMRYLSSDTLKTNVDESVVYIAAKNWILENKIRDADEINEIMGNIRFALITSEILSEEVIYDEIIDGNTSCRKLVVEAMRYHSNVFTQPLYGGSLNKPRGKPGVAMISNGSWVKGFETKEGERSLHFMSFPDFAKKTKGKFLEAGTSIVWDGMYSVQIRNFLFIFGTNLDGYQNFGKRYDASTDAILDLAPAPGGPKVGSSTVCHGNIIYMIGGMLVKKDAKCALIKNDIVNNVYAYDVGKDCWSVSSPLPECVAYAGVTVLHENIFVAGGYSQNETTAKVTAFDTKAKLWLTKAELNQKRCEFVLETVDDILYAVGGRVIDGDVIINSAEKYDVLSNQWTIVVRNGQVKFQAAKSYVFDNRIYIVGGQLAPHEMFSFDTKKNKVRREVGALPDDMQRNVSALMTLPKLL